MGGAGSGRRNDEEIEKKIEIFRQITGDGSFFVKNLPSDIDSRLGFCSRTSMLSFLSRLVTGKIKCGRQLFRLSHGEYAWINLSKGGATEARLRKPVFPPRLSSDTTMDENTAANEKRLTSLCQSAEAGILEIEQRIKALEKQLSQARGERVDALRRLSAFQSELDKLKVKK